MGISPLQSAVFCHSLWPDLCLGGACILGELIAFFLWKKGCCPMRDTLALFAVMAALVGYLYWTHEHRGQKPNEKPPSAPQSAPVQKSAKAKARTYHQVSRRSEKSKTPALPTIYTRPSEKEGNEASAQQTVHGVPIQEFLASSKNQLPQNKPQPVPSGVRIFVQCMELRKGTASELSEKECSGLAANSFSEGKRLIGTTRIQ
jgi:hypothetical protein